MVGIEPTYAAWEAAVLPLNYTRILSVRTAENAARAERQTNPIVERGQSTCRVPELSGNMLTFM